MQKFYHDHKKSRYFGLVLTILVVFFLSYPVPIGGNEIHRILLQGYNFDPLIKEPQLTDELKTDLSKQHDYGYYIVQCNGPVQQSWRKSLEIITSQKTIGSEKNLHQKIQMFSMASYNLDKFREFIFKSKFFERFEVESGLKSKLASDDVELMKFAFDWLKFSLFGDKTIQIKS